MKTLVMRLVSKTPKWWRVIRNSAAVLATIGGALLTAPVSLPAIVITIAGYMVAIGAVVAAVSQTAVQVDTDD